jgi:hypothetical protein
MRRLMSHYPNDSAIHFSYYQQCPFHLWSKDNYAQVTILPPIYPTSRAVEKESEWKDSIRKAERKRQKRAGGWGG